MATNVLAYDFGASSGRAMLGSFDGSRISINEIHRFSNDPVVVGNEYYWDILRLYHEIKTGLILAKEHEPYESIGIDCWGVNFGLLDKAGRLMGNVRHYRDEVFEHYMQELLKEIPSEVLYQRTGIQLLAFNTVFQLKAMKEQQPWMLENADTLLMLADLFNYFLCGQKHTEYSMASTSALLDVNTKGWDFELINKLGIDKNLFTDIVMPGKVIGTLSSELCDELMIKPAKVISIASHDTASAVMSVPKAGGDAAYISCGTWSLFGTELETPNTSKAAMQANFTNEGGFGGSIRFLKNIMGLWLIQESRRHWKRAGDDYSFAELEKLALECPPFESIIDVDDGRFSPPGDMPGRVQQFCRETGQPVPQSVGQIMQCIYGSLALKYRETFENMQRITGKKFDSIHMVGGGIKDTLLCRLTASACKTDVYAGPVEATVIGNIAAQLIALGEIKDLAEAREIIRNSFKIVKYEPSDTQLFDKAYEKYLKVRR